MRGIEEARQRRTGRQGLARAVVSLVSLVGGCIIAEPPQDLPPLPAFHPVIMRGSVVPPANRILTVFPQKFVVPVELVDPTVTFQWRVFIDYNPQTGDFIKDRGVSKYDPHSAPGGVRVLEVSLPAPDEGGPVTCHTIEFLVAGGFRGDFEGRQAHTPDNAGGDSVVWFYAPAGDTRSCPLYDPKPVQPSTDAALQ